MPSTEEMRDAFFNLGLYGSDAYLAAELKIVDLMNGLDLPLEYYINKVKYTVTETTSEGCDCVPTTD